MDNWYNWLTKTRYEGLDKSEIINSQKWLNSICDFINNTESEDYIKLSDKEVEDIAGKIVNDVFVKDADLKNKKDNQE